MEERGGAGVFRRDAPAIAVAASHPGAAAGRQPAARELLAAVAAAADAGADIIELDAGAVPAPLIATVRRHRPRPVVAVRAARRDAAEAAARAGAGLLAAAPGCDAGWLAATARTAGAGVVAGSVAGAEKAAAYGVSRDAIVVEAPRERNSPAVAERLPGIVAAGWPVLVTVDLDASGGEAAGAVALATAAVYAWLGARIIRVALQRAPGIPDVRDAVDMVASIRGVRPPAVSRRGLA